MSFGHLIFPDQLEWADPACVHWRDLNATLSAYQYKSNNGEGYSVAIKGKVWLSASRGSVKIVEILEIGQRRIHVIKKSKGNIHPNYRIISLPLLFWHKVLG